MAAAERLICTAADLQDGGDAVRFECQGAQGTQPAFVLRWRGQVYAWRNECRHAPVELDWNPGRFLDDSGLYLVCTMHGALYEPDTGLCVSGPCTGKALYPLTVVERDSAIYLIET